MSENEEAEWRSGGAAEEAGQEETAAASTQKEDQEEKKEELQERVQAKAEDLGGEEASLIKDTEEEEKESIPITETKYEPPSKKERKTRKPSKSKAAPSKKDINLINMSKQLARIEKVIQSLQSSFNKIDRQSNTMKQLYGIVTQLQTQMHRIIQQKQQQHRIQKKKGKPGGIAMPKK
jgi:hypothetical protein